MTISRREVLAGASSLLASQADAQTFLDWGNFQTQVSGTSVGLAPIGARGALPNTYGGTGNTQFMAQKSDIALTDVVNARIVCVWPNWRATTGAGSVAGGAAEIAPGATMTARTSFHYYDINGVLQTVRNTDLATGSDTSIAADGANLLMQTPVIPYLGRGARVFTRIFGTMPNGMNYGQWQADYANGDIFQYGATGNVTDLTGVNTTFTDTYQGSLDMFGHVALLTAHTAETLAILSDSRDMGLGDRPNDAYGLIGQWARLTGRRMPLMNLSIPGDTAADFAVASQSTRRRALAAMTKRKAFGYGINDIVYQNQTAATTLSLIDSIGGIPKTLDPATVDATTNTPNRPTRESERLAFNAAVRGRAAYFDPAIILESGTTPGTWGSLTYETDGTHESNTGNGLVVSNSNFDFANLGNPPAAIFRYPNGASYQSMLLADGWGTQLTTLTTKSAASPNGPLEAAVLKEDATATAQHYTFKQISVALASTSKTATFFAKRVVGVRNVALQIQRSDFSALQRIAVNLGTGAVIYGPGSAGGMTTGTPVVTAVNGYWQIKIPFTFDATVPANPYIFFMPLDGTGADQISGDNVSSNAIWGFDFR